MSRLPQWIQAVGRLFVLFGHIGVSSARFLFKSIPVFLYNLVMHELLWKWWLGYGERPLRVLAAVAVILVATWLLYWQIGAFVLDSETIPQTIGRSTWHNALYYSLASFSALGYGSWVSEPVGWVKWAGAVQPLFGITSAVALSIALTQRISR